jgi:hypothetical protein
LAKRTGGLTERYVREWALAQAANGFVDYNATSRKFSLSPEQATVFAQKDSPFYLAGAFDLVAAMIEGEQKVEHSFRTGAGVRWGDSAGCQLARADVSLPDGNSGCDPDHTALQQSALELRRACPPIDKKTRAKRGAGCCIDMRKLPTRHDAF